MLLSQIELFNFKLVKIGEILTGYKTYFVTPGHIRMMWILASKSSATPLKLVIFKTFWSTYNQFNWNYIWEVPYEPLEELYKIII